MCWEIMIKELKYAYEQIGKGAYTNDTFIYAMSRDALDILKKKWILSDHIRLIDYIKEVIKDEGWTKEKKENQKQDK